MKVKDLFLPLVLGGAALFAYDHFKSVETGTAKSRASGSGDARQALAAPEDLSWRSDRNAAPAVPAAASRFQCDGRTHCSQMTSCAEATYFLQHCPNTKMDGNGDGEPCEQQWCN